MKIPGCRIQQKRVVPTKQCRSIISISYISQLLAARGVKSGVYKARQGATLKTFIYTKQFIPIPGDSNEKKPKLCYSIAIAIGTLFSVFLEFSGYYRLPF